jgi:Virulence factor
VPEYQITYWREIPSLVVVRAGDDVTKAALSPRFQEAIDEAAMRLGDVSSDDYLAGWTRSGWTPADGTTAAVADEVVAGLEARWTPEAVAAYLDTVAAEPTQSDVDASASSADTAPGRSA